MYILWTIIPTACFISSPTKSGSLIGEVCIREKIGEVWLVPILVILRNGWELLWQLMISLFLCISSSFSFKSLILLAILWSNESSKNRENKVQLKHTETEDGSEAWIYELTMARSVLSIMSYIKCFRSLYHASVPLSTIAWASAFPRTEHSGMLISVSSWASWYLSSQPVSSQPLARSTHPALPGMNQCITIVPAILPKLVWSQMIHPTKGRERDLKYVG